MVISASAPSAAAFADAVASAEGWAPTKSDTAFCERSNTRSLKPAPARRAAIGRPIMPRPMKAMVAGGLSGVMAFPAEVVFIERQRAAGNGVRRRVRKKRAPMRS